MPRNFEAPPLSPRSQMFRRKPSTNRGDGNGEGLLGPIPERDQAPPATSRPRGSTNSKSSFVFLSWNETSRRVHGPTVLIVLEAVLSSILAAALLALGDDTNAPPGAGMNAFVLGLMITVLSMAFVYNTGAAMNRLLNLGPRLACLAVGYGEEISRNGY